MNVVYDTTFTPLPTRIPPHSRIHPSHLLIPHPTTITPLPLHVVISPLRRSSIPCRGSSLVRANYYTTSTFFGKTFLPSPLNVLCEIRVNGFPGYETYKYILLRTLCTYTKSISRKNKESHPLPPTQIIVL